MSKERTDAFYPEAIFESKNTIEISVEEYARLKDIETRFTIIKGQMLHAEYCPIHTQIILGIEKEYKKSDELVIPPFLKKKFNIPEEKREEIFFGDGNKQEGE